MFMIKVGVNGYGVIGKRVAEAVSKQNDMKLVGIAKREPDYKAKVALRKKFDLYASEDLKKFEGSGVEVKGTLNDLLSKVDILVDCTPEEVGATNKQLYEKAGVKAIWQGGEEHELTNLSFNAYANYNKALGAKFVRVVSCNTTGLIRTLWPLHKEIGIKDVSAFLVRRAADPSETKKGPINAIEPELEMPSHHGPDVQTVVPDLKIETTAVKVPTTLMHLHNLKVKLSRPVTEKEILSVWQKYPRVMLVSGKDGIKTTAQIMEFAKDFGRERGDLYEIAVWNKIKVVGDLLYYFQAVHQESDVVPENVDAIRAMMNAEKDGSKSIEKTDKSLENFSIKIQSLENIETKELQ